MQLGRKLAEGYAVDISDEPELTSPAVPVETAADAGSDVTAAVAAESVQV